MSADNLNYYKCNKCSTLLCESHLRNKICFDCTVKELETYQHTFIKTTNIAHLYGENKRLERELAEANAYIDKNEELWSKVKDSLVEMSKVLEKMET